MYDRCMVALNQAARLERLQAQRGENCQMQKMERWKDGSDALGTSFDRDLYMVQMHRSGTLHMCTPMR